MFNLSSYNQFSLMRNLGLTDKYGKCLTDLSTRVEMNRRELSLFEQQIRPLHTRGDEPRRIWI